MRNSDLRRAAFATAGAILALLLSASAGHTAARKGFYTIDAAELSPALSGSSYRNYAGSGLSMTDQTSGCFNTGVNLPDRATVTNVAAVYKSGSGADVVAYLMRTRLSDGFGDIIAGKILTDDSFTRKTTNITVNTAYAVVDNARYSYAFEVCVGPGTSDKFYAARVIFTTAQ